MSKKTLVVDIAGQTVRFSRSASTLTTWTAEVNGLRFYLFIREERRLAEIAVYFPSRVYDQAMTAEAVHVAYWGALMTSTLVGLRESVCRQLCLDYAVSVEVRGARVVGGSGAVDGRLLAPYLELLAGVNSERKRLGYGEIYG